MVSGNSPSQPAARRSQDGFTLLEVMVAMAILSIGLVMLLEAHSASIKISDATRRMSVASTLARDVMTEFEMHGYPSPGTESGDFSMWYPNMYPGYRWEIEVVESSFWSYVREVYVKVIWQEGVDERNIELTSFISAMDVEEQDIAASESSGEGPDEEAMVDAYNNAASGTKDAEAE